MARVNAGLAIVIQRLPPGSPIGEGLLRLAGLFKSRGDVCIITQGNRHLKGELETAGVGQDVKIRTCKAHTNSASRLILRAIDGVLFMLWTIVSLALYRPKIVYVASSPPILVPWIVSVYCNLCGARYIYHLQDIHPEATNTVLPMSRLAFKFLAFLDNYTIRHAKALVTLTDEMKTYLQESRRAQCPIYLLDNPSLDVHPLPFEDRIDDVVFCGNAGRLQHIPLLIASIAEYLQKNGALRFTFAGGGVYGPDLRALADSYDQVSYLGTISPRDAAELVNKHRWALLPIDDKVTKYAFPSKSSAYALSGVGVLAICSEFTSVARWVKHHKVGLVCVADQSSLVSCFFSLENGAHGPFSVSEEVRVKLQVSYFAKRLSEIILT